MTRSRQTSPRTRSRTKKRRSTDDAELSPQRIGGVFLLVTAISLLLTVFVLFMQRQWKLPGQRALLVVHNGVDEVRKPLSIVVMRFSEQELFFLPIPEEQSVNVLSNDISYSSDALVGYTQLEEYRWEYLEYLVSLEYGVVLDGIVWTDLSPEELQANTWHSVAGQSLWRRAPTTLAYWDRVRWWRGMFGIPSYQVDQLTVGEF